MGMGDVAKSRAPYHSPGHIRTVDDIKGRLFEFRTLLLLLLKSIVISALKFLLSFPHFVFQGDMLLFVLFGS